MKAVTWSEVESAQNLDIDVKSGVVLLEVVDDEGFKSGWICDGANADGRLQHITYISA